MIANQSNHHQKKITLDCDAFSFLIIAEEITMETMCVIKNFLLHFGTCWSSISVPSKAIGAEKIDSMFGSTRSVGCQHLESSKIGQFFMSGGTQVITSPVKIAVHHSCRIKIVEHLCTFPHQYPMELSSNKDICFDPTMASNKPPYGQIIEALLNGSFVTEMGKYIIQVADMGTRHCFGLEEHGECPLQIMFDHVKKMRETSGVSVEITQLDIAFTIPTTKNELIQCSYNKLQKKVNKDSCVDFMSTEHWALHAIQTTKDGKMASK